MVIKRFFWILFIFVFIGAGLGYGEETDAQNFDAAKIKGVNLKNGVNFDEALAIGRAFLKHKVWDNDYFLFKFLTEQKKDVWRVVFLKKQTAKSLGKTQSIRIDIDKKSGKIMEFKIQDGYHLG